MSRQRSALIVLVTLVIATLVTGVIALVLFGRLVTRIDRLNEDLAAYQSARSVVAMTLTDASAVIAQSYAGRETACRLLTDDIARNGGSNRAEIAIRWNFCPSAGGPPAAPVFISLYLQAMGERLSGNFAAAVDLYGRALAAMGRGGQAEWLARAYEGRAYALYRLGMLDRAARDIAKAQALATRITGGYVYAATTAAKILCRTQAAPAAVQRLIAEERRSLLATQARATNPEARRYAEQDLRALEEDAELYRVCRAAKLKPAATNASA